MTLRNAFADLALDTTLIAVRDRLLGVLDIAGTDHNGVVRRLRTDVDGRLKQSHGQPPPTTASLTAVAQAATLAMDGFALATFYTYGAAHAGFNLNFEASPDSTNGTDGTWFSTIGVDTASSAATAASTSTGVLPSNGVRAVEVFAPGASWVRARATARTSGTLSVMAVASTASIDPAPAIQVPTHAVTQSGTWAVNVNSGQQIIPAPAATAGNLSQFKFVSGGTDATSKGVLRAAAGKPLGFHLANTSASWRYLKLHNLTTAPTIGTTAVVAVYALPPNSVTEHELIYGPAYGTGVSFSVTTGVADADVGLPAANEVVGMLYSI